MRTLIIIIVTITMSYILVSGSISNIQDKIDNYHKTIETITM